MAINDELTMVARDCKSILDVCDKIVDVAGRLLDRSSTGQFDGPRPPARISAKDRDSDLQRAARLSEAPALARVVCKDESNRTRTFYVCPCAPPPGVARANLVSIYSPYGRLAILPLGASFETPKGEILTVTERAVLKPQDYRRARDVFDVLFESVYRERLRVKSVKAFEAAFGDRQPASPPKEADGETTVEAEPVADGVAPLAPAEEDVVPLVPAEELDVVVDEGELRQPLTGPSLVQPPLLDLVQDAFCRAPGGVRQFLVGPPGSGKTTALVRRVDFRLSREALEAENPALPDKLDKLAPPVNALSWLFVAPTDLARQSLRDSFALLSTPGFEQNVKTWDELRLELAGLFRLLARGEGDSGLRLTDAKALTDAGLDDLVGWHEDFTRHQQRAYLRSLKVQARRLGRAEDADLAELGRELLDLLGKREQLSPVWLRQAVDVHQELIDQQAAAWQEKIGASLRSAFQRELERAPGLVGEIVEAAAREGRPSARLAGLRGSSDQSRWRSEALRLYSAAVLHEAAAAVERPSSRSGRWSALASWLGRGRLPENLAELGVARNLLRALNRFRLSSPSFADGYFGSLVPNYLNFRRRDRLRRRPGVGGFWELEAPEVDLLLLSFLEVGAELLKLDRLGSGLTDNWTLSLHRRLTRNQVAVDDAVNLTPLQLKCLAALTEPVLGAFSAAGDFDQRVSGRGLKSWDELDWAAPKIAAVELSVNYRQSPHLTELTDLLSGSAAPRYARRRYLSATGPRPAFTARSGALAQTADWLAGRLAEILERVRTAPTMAVLTADPAEAAPLAEALTKALAPYKLLAAVSRGGQPVGPGGEVRVLAIEEVRGLEFEAVFVVDPEALIRRFPGHHWRQLFLAASRAATYLGLAFKNGLPPEFDNLAPHLTADWAQPTAPLETLSL
ncbi:MAG: ATP-binding domain-containing protein [Deltaproteobacteria bacterium]|nr:ATP-binding domain-containing protein [Deltaproteobacteria bacterium]